MRKVESRIKINIAPENVLRAFTDFDLIKQWWKVEKAMIEKRDGGIYALAWNISEAGFKYVSTGIISSFKPAEHLYIDNFLYFSPDKPILGPMSLKIEVKLIEEGTELYLCQDGYKNDDDWNWYFEAVISAWPSVLLDLKQFLET
jgi:uncharacterized protein YndB with AHSA1/START domain